MGAKICLSACQMLFAAAAFLPQGSSAAMADLVVGHSRVWPRSLRKCLIALFEKEASTKVRVVLGSPGQWLNQIAVRPNEPPFRVIYNATKTGYIAAQHGLVNKFATKSVPDIAFGMPRSAYLTDGYAAINNYAAIGIIYNANKIKNPPKTWKESLAGTIAGKWHASMPDVNYPAGGLYQCG